MKNRNLLAVFFLPFVTFGIYSWHLAIKTKTEMNNLGADIPTAWIWLIPFVGIIWWLWKYCEGVELVTKGRVQTIVALIVLFVFGSLSQTILQYYFNQVTPDQQV